MFSKICFSGINVLDRNFLNNDKKKDPGPKKLPIHLIILSLYHLITQSSDHIITQSSNHGVKYLFAGFKMLLIFLNFYFEEKKKSVLLLSLVKRFSASSILDFFCKNYPILNTRTSVLRRSSMCDACATPTGFWNRMDLSRVVTQSQIQFGTDSENSIFALFWIDIPSH